MKTRWHLAATIGAIMAATANVTPAAEEGSATAPARPGGQLHLTLQGRPEHPTVYVSRADVDRARRNREKYAWGKAAADKILKDAEPWMNRTADEVVKLIPGPGACFAYGFSGCPVCNGTFKSWWGEGGVSSLSDPGHVKCVNGHRLPDDAHPDPGDGWSDKLGKHYYFVGTYNSYAIQQLSDAMENLATAYVLTGDEKYAERSALILDHLARIYPTCDKGSWDYPSTPPSGRFNRPWYQVARMLVHYTNAYDLLMMGKSLEAPSSVNGRSRRENIEQNLLLNGAGYCYAQSLVHPSLNNGECDYIRGCIAVGVALGIPEYVAWGVDGPYGIRNMIENNIDRDGQYFETSSGYSHHARYLYLNTAELLQNYTDAAHPNGIRLIDMPKFRAMSTLPKARIDAAGMLASLGDDAPHKSRAGEPGLRHSEDLQELEHLCALDRGGELWRLLVQITGGKLNKARESLAGLQANNSGATTGMAQWLLFHAIEPEADTSAKMRQEVIHPLTGLPLTSSDLVAQRGLSILRSGSGADRVAVTLRSGPTLNHGNYDELNLDIYARGFEMSYDLGYSLGSSHVYNGWAKVTASHNTVLVDETSQLKAGLAGGSVKAFAALPGVQMTRADDPRCYASQKVQRYDRTILMVDAPSGDASYMLDVFRVAGGKKHDYIFHGLGTDLTSTGLSPGEPGKGSLAGPDLAFGDKIGTDGDIQGIPNKPYYVAPPGNGFGFLMRPRAATPTAPWSADWKIADDAHLRLTALTTDETKVVTADAPGIYPHFPRAAYVLLRRSGADVRSTFATIIESYGQARVVRSIESLESGGTGDDRDVAARVTFDGGVCDYVLQAGSAKPATFKDAERELQLTGGTAVVRFDGTEPAVVTLLGAKRIASGPQVVELSQTEIAGAIDAADFDKAILYTRTPLPVGDVLAGQFLYISSPAYAQESPYRIATVERQADGRCAVTLEPTSLILGRGHLDKSPVQKNILPNVVPHEYAKALGHKPSGFFKGKKVATPDGRAATTIREMDADAMRLTVENGAEFRAGDDLVFYDIQSGDGFRIPACAQLRKDAAGAWTAVTNVTMTVEVDGKRISISASRTPIPVVPD